MAEIRGAIFDVDGTLLDSMGIWVDASDIYLERVHGIQAEDGLGDILYPMTLAESGAYMKETYGLETEVDDIIAGVVQVVEDFYRDEVQAKPGMVELVNDLHSRGVPMIVATNNDPKLVELGLSRVGIRDCFSEIITVGSLNTSKRETKIYLHAAEKLGCRPEETAVYEDVLLAAQSAKRAGFYLVGVYDKYSSQDWEEIADLADEIIK